MKKKINVYHPKSKLPDFICLKGDRLWIAEKLIAEGSAGPYDVLWDFGQSLAKTREVVPSGERIRQNTSNIIFLAFSDREVKEALEANTRLVNSLKANPDEAEQRFVYQQNLATVYQKLVPRALEFAGRNAVLFPPKRGGELVAQFFKLYGRFPPENIADYVLKRIVLRNEAILVGVRDVIHWPAIDSQSTIIFGDDCLASFISAYATLDLIRRRAKKQPTCFVACVSTATQKGVEWLIKAAADFGYQKVLFVGGLPVFGMTPEYYLLRLEDEGFPPNTYAVGDMGLWTRALPEEFNNKASWNIGRVLGG